VFAHAVQVLYPPLVSTLQKSGLVAKLLHHMTEDAAMSRLPPVLTVPSGVDSDEVWYGRRRQRTPAGMTPAGDGVVIGDAVRGTNAIIQFKLTAHEGEGPRPPLLVGLVGVEALPGGGPPTVAFVVLLTEDGRLVTGPQSAVEGQAEKEAQEKDIVPFGSGVVRRVFQVELVGSEPPLSVGGFELGLSKYALSSLTTSAVYPHYTGLTFPPVQVHMGLSAEAVWPPLDNAKLRSPSLSVFPVVYCAPGTDPRVEVSRASLLRAPVEWTFARLRSLTGPPLPPTADLHVRGSVRVGGPQPSLGWCFSACPTGPRRKCLTPAVTRPAGRCADGAGLGGSSCPGHESGPSRAPGARRRGGRVPRCGLFALLRLRAGDCSAAGAGCQGADRSQGSTGPGLAPPHVAHRPSQGQAPLPTKVMPRRPSQSVRVRPRPGAPLPGCWAGEAGAARQERRARGSP
jgi:hypothetical protein